LWFLSENAGGLMMDEILVRKRAELVMMKLYSFARRLDLTSDKDMRLFVDMGMEVLLGKGLIADDGRAKKAKSKRKSIFYWF
jgi:hypothetical protein